MSKEDRYCLNKDRLRVDRIRFEHSHETNCSCDDHSHNCSCNHHQHDNKKLKIVLIFRVIISLALLLIAYFIKGLASNIILSISYLIISYDVLFNAFKNIIKGKVFDENFLMSIASLTALVVFFINPDVKIDGFDGVLVMILYQVGEFLQHLASDKSRKSIEKMMDLNVDKVIKLKDNKRILIDANKIEVGDILIIKPGEVIPTDGIITFGSSSINTSSLTGESRPLDVKENDKVLSGCINNQGLIYIKAITTLKQSTASKVKEVVMKASKNKAKHERFITKFAKIYTPIVILISLCVMFIVPLILGFNEHFINYLYKGLSIMVISCPCALVISVPLSYFIAIGKAAKNSILIKGSCYLEQLSNIEHIAFDKTGTLTNGRFVISKIESKNNELMVDLLYNSEKNLTHPISMFISKYFENQAKEIEIIDITNIAGFGLKAYHNSKIILIGNSKLMVDNNIKYEDIEDDGSIIYVSYDNKYLGYILLKDQIKEEAFNCIKALKEKYNISLISGDNEKQVKEVAKKLNIDNYYNSMLPIEKASLIKKIKENERVLYVGDGMNDAACMINATTSIAMKSLGSEIAINASDIVIMDDRVSSVNKAILIAKKTMKIVKQNIIGSILIKVILMVIAILFDLPMFVAIIGDVGVCLLAILNSLRIMYGKIR